MGKQHNNMILFGNEFNILVLKKYRDANPFLSNNLFSIFMILHQVRDLSCCSIKRFLNCKTIKYITLEIME